MKANEIAQLLTLKIEMERMVEKYGLSDPRTIKVSQRVDELVLAEQKRRLAG